MNFRISLSLVLAAFIAAGFCGTPATVFSPEPPAHPKRFCAEYAKWLGWVIASKDYVEITDFQGVSFDLRYATFKNGSGHDLYCGSRRAFLNKNVADKLKAAVALLRKEHPGYRLRIFDAARPLYAQDALRAPVRGTPYANFVSSPSHGSVHNYGYAVDLTMEDSLGRPLDMGTDFDSFEAAAGSRGEKAALKSGRLTELQIAHRRILRRAMKGAGFIALPSEWWHFNAAASAWVRANCAKTPF